MQENDGAAPLKVHSRLFKQRAIKILLDYSRDTGRGATLIRNEIIEVSGANATEGAPLIQRQDIENWFSGSLPTDQKFALVLAFLRHPQTLDRPELAKARTLLEPTEAVLADGRTLAKFTDNGEVVQFRTPARGSALEPKERAKFARKIAGIYSVRKAATDVMYIGFSPVAGEDFLLAHLLFGTDYRETTFRDWQVTRASGFATVGKVFTVYLRRPYGPAINLTLGVKFQDQGPIDQLYGTAKQMHYSLMEALPNWAKLEASAKLRSLRMQWHSLDIKRISNSELEQIFDEIWWRMPE